MNIRIGTKFKHADGCVWEIVGPKSPILWPSRCIESSKPGSGVPSWIGEEGLYSWNGVDGNQNWLVIDPTDTRELNVAAANAYAANPNSRLLDGRGQRQGKVWDLFMQNLSYLVEKANCQPEPQTLSNENLEAAMLAAIQGIRMAS